MAQIKPHTLSGFMELLPQPQLQMEAIMEVLRNTYSLYGFTPLDTPAIEDVYKRQTLLTVTALKSCPSKIRCVPGCAS